MSNRSTNQRGKSRKYLDEEWNETKPPTPASTVVLIRNSPTGPEVLMLRKNRSIKLGGGIWVFPGGRVDQNDQVLGKDEEAAARQAATREAKEETGVQLDPTELIWISHWTPSTRTTFRFVTWFYVAVMPSTHVDIDGSEIVDYFWSRPTEVLARHTANEIDLLLPTWITLYQLSLYASMDTMVQKLREVGPRFYETRPVKLADGSWDALLPGDAGYEDWDAGRDGARHRVNMPRKNGFTIENTVVEY